MSSLWHFDGEKSLQCENLWDSVYLKVCIRKLLSSPWLHWARSVLLHVFHMEYLCIFVQFEIFWDIQWHVFLFSCVCLLQVVTITVWSATVLENVWNASLPTPLCRDSVSFSVAEIITWIPHHKSASVRINYLKCF